MYDVRASHADTRVDAYNSDSKVDSTSFFALEAAIESGNEARASAYRSGPYVSLLLERSSATVST